VPHEKAPLSKWCGGPISRCESADFDCEKCTFVDKEKAVAAKHKEEEK